MKKITCLLLILFCLSGSALGSNKESVYVIPVKGIIDLGLSGFIKRALEEAKQNNSQYIILEIDTFGGRVDAAVEICDYLEKIKPIPTIAFIDDQAWSAGALIALATQEIIMSPGSSIGSAEPRSMGFAGKDELTDEKTVSAIRAKFKSIAEENNHPANIALAMVDKDVELKKIMLKDKNQIVTNLELEELKSEYKDKDIAIIKTVNPKGKLLNLTAKEAKEYDLIKVILNNRKEVLDYLGIKEAKLVGTKPTWSENLVRFITHPLVSPLLLTLGFLGIIFELKIPGWGISGTLGVLFLALFFWGHYLVGLANWTEIIIFVSGVILLFLEIFVIPGFGIAGILGIVLIFGGIFLALIKYPLTVPKIELYQAFSTLGFSIIGVSLAILLSLKFLPQAGFWKKIILSAQEKKEEGFRTDVPLRQYLGKKGKALTILRPNGRAIFEDKVLDVVSEGGFIEQDSKVEVIKIESNKVIVRKINYV